MNESVTTHARAAASPLDLFDSPRAWRMVWAAFAAMFTVYGVAYSFGAFFKPMAAEFAADRSATSAVFSITVFLWSMLGPVTGAIADRFGPRVVVTIGAVSMAVGLALTSLSHSIVVAYVTYGIGVGLGVSCAYVPMIAVVGGWFLRRRNSALGIAVSGIGVGVVCAAPLAARLVSAYGWRHTYVIFAIGSAAILLACAFVSERPPVHVRPMPIHLGAAIRTRAFVLLYVSSLFNSMALFVPFVYLPAFAHDRGASEVASAALIGVIGGASVVGRLGLGNLADRFGAIRLYQASMFVVGISYLIWLVADSYGWLVVYALVMGMGYGGFVALSPAVMAELFGVERLGSVLGALYTGGGLGALVGPPLAGVLIDRSGGYSIAIACACAFGLVAWAILIPLERHPNAH